MTPDQKILLIKTLARCCWIILSGQRPPVVGTTLNLLFTHWLMGIEDEGARERAFHHHIDSVIAGMKVYERAGPLHDLRDNETHQSKA